jgi:hypothetical protein
MTPFRIPETKICDWAKADQTFAGEFIKFAGLPPKGSCPVMEKVHLVLP